NYSYEDFIQGLRPDVENESELSFKRQDGIFKVISDKALQNLKYSLESKSEKKSFNNAFNELTRPLIEDELEEIEIEMKRASFYITEITDRSIRFRKNSGNSVHTLSINTLKKMYEKETADLIEGGVWNYYDPLLSALLSLGKSGIAKKVVRKNYVIIIDEINRANISRVFGELITLIEKDKRSHGSIPLKATLPSGEEFQVPSNLYIIGTMNTADKSIALLDIALRRRFVFEAMYPEYDLPKLKHANILKKLNAQIIEKKGHDFQIGHSYFMGEEWSLKERMNNKVIPLLFEYFMNDADEVAEILKHASFAIDKNKWPIRVIDSIPTNEEDEQSMQESEEPEEEL
ncbi:MAG: AAA domain-containing protein, partial [Bacteroidia bacterium]|nr:AAA domain-containing protein [Bacteroidia bacterium]